MRHLLAICALLATFALSACGGDAPAGSSEETAVVDGSAQVLAPVGRAEVRAAAACRAQLGDFIASMQRLRGRLATGLSYEQYAASVKRVRTGYDALQIKRLPPDCVVAAGAPGESAFNRYIEAANAWGGCLADAGCNSRVVEPRLQREWRIASRFLSEASTGLRG